MPEVKNATPTIYNGVKYRSKLEARCAKILDDYGIEFQYETVKLELLPKFEYRGVKYQPWTYTSDFLILKDVLLEVKGYKKADNYTNKRKMIMKHLLDNSLPYSFYEIYSESHLKSVLNKYKELGTFYSAYIEYEKELEVKKKAKRAKKKNSKRNENT